ncbi:hypothetical protein [Dryocola sp. BD613]|uniref:hypothetical protein n=1 Tax=Dryocola sp. BD613 TaxID=3133272 RepID=UPI003F4FA9C2
MPAIPFNSKILPIALPVAQAISEKIPAPDPCSGSAALIFSPSFILRFERYGFKKRIFSFPITDY